jgi:mannose-6-phosphate isomerase-like protein (cupin superfamily)
MEENQKYTIIMEPNFGFLKLIDTQSLIDDCSEKWFNQTLCKVNDCIIRLGVFNEGEFHWHKHDNEDEFFFVIKGELFIEFNDDKLQLKQHQGITIPKGVLHRTYIKQPTAVIMVEGYSVSPTGD